MEDNKQGLKEKSDEWGIRLELAPSVLLAGGAYNLARTTSCCSLLWDDDCLFFICLYKFRSRSRPLTHTETLVITPQPGRWMSKRYVDDVYNKPLKLQLTRDTEAGFSHAEPVNQMKPLEALVMSWTSRTLLIRHKLFDFGPRQRCMVHYFQSQESQCNCVERRRRTRIYMSFLRIKWICGLDWVCGQHCVFGWLLRLTSS